MKTICGKKALITGAASGIGRATALALAREGASLYLVDIDEERLAGTADEARQWGVEVVVRRGDMGRPAEISALVQNLLRHWGELDILINNAGVAYYGQTERMTAQQWDWLMSINLLSPIQLTRELLPVLLSRPESHIVNVCSMWGLVAVRKLAAYHASKYGLVGFSESLRAEYAGRGLGVTALCPGFVKTRMFEAAVNDRKEKKTPPAWACVRPETVAARVVRSIRRNRGLVLVSPIAHVLWGFKRLSPRLFEFFSRSRRRRKKTEVRSQKIEGPKLLPTSGNTRKAG